MFNEIKKNNKNLFKSKKMINQKKQEKNINKKSNNDDFYLDDHESCESDDDESDESDDDESDDDESETCESETCESDDESDDNDESEDILKYRKLLQKMFPSKFIDKKVESGEKIKKIIKNEKENLKKSRDFLCEEKLKKNKKEEKIIKNKKEEKLKKNTKEEKSIKNKKEEKSIKNKKEEKEKTDKKKKIQNENINIILQIDDDYDSENDSDWEDEENDSETENEDDDISSDESDESDESHESDEDEDKGEDESVKNKEQIITKYKSENNNNNDNYKIKKNKIILKPQPEPEQQPSNEIIKILKDIDDNNILNIENKNILNECIDYCKNKLTKIDKKKDKKIKKEQERNTRIFKKIIKDKNTLNDNKYFKKLDIENQKKIIKEIRKINEISRIEKPYRILLLESDIPTEYKNIALKKISLLKYMDSYSNEYYKNKNWVDTFMRIPFGKFQHLDMNIDKGIDKCHEFMETAKKTLDLAVYGLNDAKIQIMQLLGQLITNPSAIGTSVAIHGVPGSGKTTLLKDGVSKILNRPFAFIALGGATDSSFLEGHGYTYEGSTWGKIVQILIESRCMNPVIYFDELDKISDTPKGEEILNILVHLTDTTQNNQFHDKYFSEINFDLSRCLFIFSYNDESKISPILLDRMYKIKTNGYSNKEKIIISKDYLLPKIREQIKFTIQDLHINDDVLYYIIENYTSNEKGVRNIKRCLEIIYSKINLFRLMKPNTNLFANDIKIKVEFPCHITKDMIDNLLKISNNTNESFKSMYV